MRKDKKAESVPAAEKKPEKLRVIFSRTLAKYLSDNGFFNDMRVCEHNWKVPKKLIWKFVQTKELMACIEQYKLDSRRQARN